MNYIIIGLGNFGSSLGMMLTDLGHEVIGVDKSMHRVATFKDNITSTICLDCTDVQALSTLPIAEADTIIVGIGEDFGASVLVTALILKKKKGKLICRAVSPVHESVFEALGVDEIVHPEQEAAEKLIKRIINPDVVDSYRVGQDHLITELLVPQRLIGSRVAEIDFRNRYQLNLIAIIKHRFGDKDLKKTYNLGQASDFVYAGTLLEKNDVMVLYGSHLHIRRFLGE